MVLSADFTTVLILQQSNFGSGCAISLLVSLEEYAVSWLDSPLTLLEYEFRFLLPFHIDPVALFAKTSFLL